MIGIVNPTLSLTGVCVEQPDGEVLLRNASLELRPGETVLLVGPTGSGKSTILRVIAGLVRNGEAGWKISGRLRIGGRDIDLAHESRAVGAVVFQDYALFDDLSVRENLTISASHAVRQSGTTQALAAALIQNVPQGASISSCSGGQKQLVAIARTLLADAPVLLLDEPNSGLDVGNASRLLKVLEAIKQQSQRPMLITVHHFQHLLPIATRVVFLNPTTKSLESISDDARDIGARLHQCAKSIMPLDQCEARTITKPEHEYRPHKRSRLMWSVRYFRSYMWQLCFSPEALLYMGLGALLVGFVSTWFTFRNSPLASYSNPLFHEELLGGIGFAQFRILVPLISGILLAARIGAIIAADQGHRVYSSQIDAMRNLGIPQRIYLGANIVIATLITSLFFLTFMFTLSAWVSLKTWVYIFPEGSRYFWREYFFALIWPAERTLPVGIVWVFAKTTLSAIAAGAVGTLLGRTRKASVVDLNKGIALAIVIALAVVLSIHTVAAFLEF